MKKLIILSALTLFISASIFAQQKRDGMRNGPEFTSEQMATIQTKKMALALDLDSNQQKSIQKVLLKAADDRKATVANFKEKREAGTKPTTEERFLMENNRLDKQLAFKGEMKKVLQKEQYEKWEKGMMQKRKNAGNKKMQHNKKGVANNDRRPGSKKTAKCPNN